MWKGVIGQFDICLILVAAIRETSAPKASASKAARKPLDEVNCVMTLKSWEPPSNMAFDIQLSSGIYTDQWTPLKISSLFLKEREVAHGNEFSVDASCIENGMIKQDRDANTIYESYHSCN